MNYTFSPQRGKPGHCLVAQVWNEKGDSIAIIESTELDKDANQLACLFSKAPEMIESLKWFVNSMNDGSLIVFTDDDQHKAVRDDNQDNINKIELLVKELES